MKRLWPALIGAMALLLAFYGTLAAQGASDVLINVIDTEGNPATVSEIGCAYSDGPGMAFERYMGMFCSSCSVYTCTFDVTRPGMGGYIQSAQLSYTQTTPSANTWQTLQGSRIAVQWSDAPWGELRVITFVLESDSPGPTPIPTLTPIPTATPPSPSSVEQLAEGFGAGFMPAFERMTSSGFPSFSADHAQWLFYAERWVAFINQGNLLYVIGGITLAAVVLTWAIERVKNPR